jgi:hypothetical protein
MKPYVEGQKLAEDEYVLKVRPARNNTENPTGFMAKLTQKGELQKSFKDWNGGCWGDKEQLPIFVVKETFKTGWKLESWRFGMSQNWARVIHPDGYTLEIYLTDFLDIVLNNTITNGKIDGMFKWRSSKLISPND